MVVMETKDAISLLTLMSLKCIQCFSANTTQSIMLSTRLAKTHKNYNVTSNIDTTLTTIKKTLTMVSADLRQTFAQSAQNWRQA